MGIRFHCPNGHRLNVKAHLAGKRGYCPHCQARVQIPVVPAEQILPAELLSEDFAMPADLDAELGGNDHPARWFVRPPSGGQFGPVDTEQLGRWIAEHRVPRDSLLLKEGWSEWQLAATVMLDGTVPADSSDSELQIEPKSPSVGPALLPVSRDRRRVRTALVLMLSLLTVGLLVVLVLILKVSR